MPTAAARRLPRLFPQFPNQKPDLYQPKPNPVKATARPSMAIGTDAVAAARAVSETAPMSPEAEAAIAAAAAGPVRPRGWLRRLIPREYLPRSGRWRLGAASAGGAVGGGASRLASSLSRSLRWKRLPGFSSLSLRSGSASAALDAVAFRVMYVVEAVVLGLALSCFFLCCGCHL